MKTSLALFGMMTLAASAGAVTIDFDELAVPGTGYYNGSDSAGGFASGGATFSTTYDNMYGSWYGFAYSDLGQKIPTESDYNDQYYIAADAAYSGDNYAVIYDPTASLWGEAPRVTFGAGQDTPLSLMVTNTAYSWATLTYGGYLVDPFEAGDWFKMTIAAYDSFDALIDTIEVFLADFRDGKSEILAAWQMVDLSSFGSGVASMTFTFSSTDTGAWGMDNPAYAAIDNLIVVPEPSTYALAAGAVVLGLGLYRRRKA